MSQNNSENSESSLTQQTAAESPSSGVLSEIQFRAELHAGPLPPPDVLERYERMQPGTLDRLLTMAEKEQQARIDHNTKAGEYKFKALELRGRNDRSDNMFAHFGQTFGFATVEYYRHLCRLCLVSLHVNYQQCHRHLLPSSQRRYWRYPLRHFCIHLSFALSFRLRKNPLVPFIV